MQKGGSGIEASGDRRHQLQHHQHKDESKVVHIGKTFPATISKADFLKGKSSWTNRKRCGQSPAKNIYLLTGVIFCGECGHIFWRIQ